MEDWYTHDRLGRLRSQQQQNWMEIADEQLSRGGNPLAAAVFVLIAISAAVSVGLAAMRLLVH